MAAKITAHDEEVELGPDEIEDIEQMAPLMLVHGLLGDVSRATMQPLKEWLRVERADKWITHVFGPGPSVEVSPEQVVIGYLAATNSRERQIDGAAHNISTGIYDSLHKAYCSEHFNTQAEEMFRIS